ncbi:MAG TPA: hypothetical protein ENN30_00210 [Candidatus Woesearchaeota archaeon]|nr:hypothetical protein [Candidatus Woesearchaeota archaeon]
MSPEEQRSYQEELQKQQMNIVRQKMLFKFVDKQARERLNRIRIVKPNLAEKVEFAIVQAVQMGHLKNQIDDAHLKQILNEVIEEKKNFRITRK